MFYFFGRDRVLTMARTYAHIALQEVAVRAARFLDPKRGHLKMASTMPWPAELRRSAWRSRHATSPGMKLAAQGHFCQVIHLHPNLFQVFLQPQLEGPYMQRSLNACFTEPILNA